MKKIVEFVKHLFGKGSVANKVLITKGLEKKPVSNSQIEKKKKK